MNNNKKKICAGLLSAVLGFTSLTGFQTLSGITTISNFSVSASSYSDIPSEYITACDWIWENRIYDGVENWMMDYDTIYDQLIAGNGTINYVVRWDSTKTLTYAQRLGLQKVLENALNQWNACLVGYADWPFEHVTVNIVGWCVLDKSCLQDIQPDENVFVNTISSTMRDYIIECGMDSDASAIPTLEPDLPNSVDYDMFFEAIDGMIDYGGFGWHDGQYLSADATLGLIDGNTSEHILLHEMGHAFGFPDYYGDIGDDDGIPPGDFPGGEGSVMEAGRAFQITTFDTWFARYAWSKLSAQSGRFDLSAITTTTETTTTTTETTTTTTTTTEITTTMPTTTTTTETTTTIPTTTTTTETTTTPTTTTTSEITTTETTSTTTTSYAAPVAVIGDINCDGICNLADVVLLQKWLLAVPDTTLMDWKAGDLHEDGVINIYDLILMKRLVVSTNR
jgi:hypothetical protein